MDAATEVMTAELAAELAANDQRRLVDPRSMPARFHNLRAMSVSPAHGFASFQGWQDKHTGSTRLGAGIHALILENRTVVPYRAIRRGKVWDAFAAEHRDDLILPGKEYDTARRIRDAVARNETAWALLHGPGTVREETILFKLGGRASRTTPDARGPHHVAELKSARCAEPARFIREVTNRAYHAQLAHQILGAASIGPAPTEAYIIAVETSEPYVTTVYQLSDATIRKGERLVTGWMARLIECERTNSWPGYSDRVELLDVPDDSFDAMFWDDPDSTEQEGADE